METRFYTPLKAVVFIANGTGRQHFEFSKQMQDHSKNMALISKKHLKPHKTFAPNYHVYRTNRFPGLKGGISVAV
jgi:hypothetical protein